MRFSLTSLVRPLVFAALGVVAVAIGVGRIGTSGFRMRHLAAARCQAINGMVFAPGERTPQFLDRENGSLTRIRLPRADTLEYASCSPWRDERNESQLVGRWTRRPPEGAEGHCEEIGLARYSLPSGRLLDAVSLDVLPSGSPCWYPGTEARVLFAGGDGRLYQLRFEDPPRDAPGEETGRGRPQPLRWRVSPPGVGIVHITDPAWPADPRWGRRILVSLSYQESGAGRLTFKEPQVWWLQLGEDGSSIEGAGRLTLADDDAADDDRESRAHERLPNLATTPDRGLALAYLTSNDRRSWNLRLIPVEIEEGTGLPRVRTSIVPRVAESCLPTAPAFSPDGRWVYGVVRERGSGPRLSRFSVVETLAALQAPRLSLLDRPGAGEDGPLNAATRGVQLSGHLARRFDIAREAGRHDSPRPVARRAVGPRGLPALDDRPDVPGGRDARGG